MKIYDITSIMNSSTIVQEFGNIMEISEIEPVYIITNYYKNNNLFVCYERNLYIIFDRDWWIELV